MHHRITAQKEKANDKEEQDDDIVEAPLDEYYCFVCGSMDNQCDMIWTFDKSNNILIFLKCLPDNSYIKGQCVGGHINVQTSLWPSSKKTYLKQ